MTRALRVLVPAVALTAALATVPSAGAADRPAPCPGQRVVADPPNDAFIGLAGLVTTPLAADPSTDFTKFWFYRDAEGTTTANVAVVNLTPGAPPPSLGLIYRFFYSAKGVDHFAEVDVAADGSATYVYGHIDTTLTVDGDTTGTLTPGPDGVVSIKIPSGAGGAEGTRFSGAYVISAYDLAAVIAATDFVPDGGSTGGISWDGAVCGADAGAVGGQTATGDMGITVKPTSLKARSAKKGAKAKKTTFSLTSTEALSDVVAKLKKGSKILGTAKLKSLNGAGKVSFKLKSLKKGKYTLAFSAKRADGSSGKLSVKVTVR
jgi:hypothetical protein